MWRRAVRPDELMHYGVLGMRWGVRRYQNYDGTRKAAGKKHEAEKRKGLSDETKKNLKRAAVAALAIGGVAASAYVISQHPEILNFAKDGKKVIEPISDTSISDLGAGSIQLALEDKTKGNIGTDTSKENLVYYDETIDKCLPECKHIEKDYFNCSSEEKHEYLHNRNKYNGHTNCQAGALAYEISRRGGDVTAKDIDTTGVMNDTFMKKCFKNFGGFKAVGHKVSNVSEYEKILLSEYKEGQRGRINVYAPNGLGNHALAFEIKDGALKIIDSESQKEYSLQAFNRIAYRGQGINLENFEHCRTDNLILNEESGFIRRVVKSN